MTTEVVLQRGARDIVLIEEDLRISTVTHRVAGFRQALEQHGIAFDSRSTVLVPPGGPSAAPRSGAVRTRTPWRATCSTGARVPEAFVVGNDYFALGLYAALRERGIRIPEDVLVIGWGDYPFSRFLDPPLSTLRLPSVEVARKASTRLLALLDGAAELEPVIDYIQPELVLRASTNR